MESYLKYGTIFCVVPNNIENASYVEFNKIDLNCLTYKCSDLNLDIKENENLEFFSNGTKGILYFCANTKTCSNGFLNIVFPDKYEILQRRENQRINIKEKVTVREHDKSFSALIEDISVGGMKIKTTSELKINEAYTVFLNFDNLNLKFTFIPARISFEDENYIISGQIKSDNASDKIELVQYCYKKQFEQKNRD